MINLKCRVLLNRIPPNYNFQADLEIARQYHLKHGVSWDFVIQNTDIKGYTSEYNPYMHRYLIQGIMFVDTDPVDADMFVFDQAEWSSPTGSQFPLLPNTPNGSCQFVTNNHKPFTIVGTYTSDHQNGITWIMIAHELVHALSELSNIKGFLMTDILDSYFHNDDPDYPGGNFAQMWVLLQPFINQQTIPDIITEVCNQNGIEPLLGISVASCEGGLKNPNIVTQNNDSHHSVDRGIFAINSYWHADVTDTQCFDPAQATQWFCNEVKNGRLVSNWHLSEHNWKPLLTPAIITKYNL